MKAYVAVFVSVFLAELGVLLSAAALCPSTALAVLAGGDLGNWIPPRPLCVMAAIGFVAIGMWTLFARP